MNADLFFRHPGLPFAECRYSTDSSRQYKPHMHKAFCVAAIETGEVVYKIGDQTMLLGPGQIGLINPGTLHSCNPEASGRRSYFMLFLDAGWCRKLQNAMWETAGFTPVQRCLLESPALYDQCIRAMKTLMDQTALLEKEELLVELAEAVFIKACRPGTARAVPPLHISRAKDLLDTDLDRDLSLERIASQLNANPYTLLRQFKAATGLTPHAFRLNCRIEQARQLLKQGTDISRVALECGFFDQSHFHRHFKAMTTMTPKAYQVNFIQ